MPANLQKVEKASIDEVFLDLSAQIHSILLSRYPELGLPAPYDDPTENLPSPPTTVLDWQADALVDLDQEETEDDDPDWDDIVMLIGSELVRDVRAAIREKLHYTCSAGIAQNKLLSKLGSAHKKPNAQTVIRNRAIQQFLSDFKYTKIRNLGGKLGDQVVATFGTATVKELLLVNVEQLKQKLGDDTGTWVYQTIRGIDHSEVNSRTQIKSMLSAKSFRPSINTYEQAIRWIRIFVADIFSRLVEEGVLENKRRPKTINLHHRQGGVTRSRQGPIPQGKSIDEISLFELAKTLLVQIIAEGRVWPCANLSLSVGGFEDGVSGNMGIGAFLLKGDDAKAMKSTTRESETVSQSRPEKKQRLEAPESSIQRFFSRDDSAQEHDEDFGSISEELDHKDNGALTKPEEPPSSLFGAQDHHAVHQQSIMAYVCTRCKKSMGNNEELQSHNDWHFAKDLQDQERASSVPTPLNRPTSTSTKKKLNKPTRATGTATTSKGEKAQSKLSFG